MRYDEPQEAKVEPAGARKLVNEFWYALPLVKPAGHVQLVPATPELHFSSVYEVLYLLFELVSLIVYTGAPMWSSICPSTLPLSA